MTTTKDAESEQPIDGRLSVMIAGREFIRWSGEGEDSVWMLWCSCGDVIPLDEVVHDHCVNCHMLCDDAALRSEAG